MATAAGITIEEFERLPEALSRNHELVDGKLVEVCGNVPKHNILRDLLGEFLRPYARQHGLGLIISEQEYDFGGNVHGPDISFICKLKRHLLDPDRRVQRFVPDLAIEIVSTNDTFKSLAKKADPYRQCGTAEVWIFSFDPRVAFVYSASRNLILGENDDFRPGAIPGFSIRIGDLLDQKGL